MASEHTSDVRDVGGLVRSVVLDVLRRRAAGEMLLDEQVIASRPEVAELLRIELAKLHQICAAGEGAKNAADEGGHQSDVVLATSKPAMVRRLQDSEPITCSHDGPDERRDREDDGAVPPRPSRKGSRGLRIRCPHCSNFVEVLTDTPYEDITCSTCGSHFSLVDRDESTRMAAPLKSIDRFDLVTRLGVGGFGTVWKARDRELDRTVAVKIPRRGQLSPSEIDQFFREARAAAQLRHPHIVPVHEVGRDGDTLFIVSDLVRGVTLSDWLTSGPTSFKEVAELCIPIADALHHAHQQGIVHRDLKPSNIMIDESGQPHLTDFGLAKREIGEITMTMDGQVLGTPAYMSPEQARGQSHWTDRRTDIYSFGVILFQLLNGELPFRGNAQMQIHQRLTEDAPDPRKLNRHIPRDLATICLKCLEREPGRRYATAADLADEFRRFLYGKPIRARPLSPPARLARWARRNPMLATTAALTIFLAIAGPLTAISIENLRDQLAVRLAESNQLIDQMESEKRTAAEKIAELQSKNDLWEGRANPSEFWPPNRDAPSREKVMETLFDRSRATLVSQLRNGEYSGEAAARGYLGLAAIAEALSKKSDARDYYQSARDELLKLRQGNPDERRYARALADCYTRLGFLANDRDRSQAATDLESARAIYQELAVEEDSDARSQIDWLESELKSATLLGAASGLKHLSRADDVRQALAASSPSEPDALYRLSCYLTQREPILAEPPTTELGDSARTKTSRLND